MPIKTPGGILEVEDAKLRASYLLANTSVGIGTSTTVPDGASIYIKEDDPTIRFQEGTTTSAARILAKSGTLRLESGTDYDQPDLTGDIAFSNIQGGTTHMIIKGDGNVGIGKESPSQMLDVSGNVQVGTANLFVDTTTGNVGIGVTDPGHNLDIVSEMNLRAVSNTASIKYNSNVVTEYVRSKKLIKYPRVAMTANSSSGYVASASREFSSSYAAYKVFNGVYNDDGQSDSWQPSGGETYSTADGTWTGGTGSPYAVALTTGITIYGEWVQLQMPAKIKLVYMNFSPIYESSGTYDNLGPHRSPRDGYILGSNDGTNWTPLKNWSGLTYDYWNQYEQSFGKIDVNDTSYYKYFRLVWTRTVGGTYAGYASAQEIEYHGIPEYDPEAHGTDVVVKSVPNVPNTDYLNLYWDAKNYSGSGDIQDETSNNRDATLNAGFDNGDIKAFTFSGAYTSNVTTSNHGLGTGDVSYTMAFWFKRTAVASTYDYLVMAGDGGTAQQAILVWINSNKLTLDHWAANIRYNEEIKLNKWYHVVVGHSGGTTPNLANDFMYINGYVPSLTQSGTPATFNLQGTKLTLGSEHNGTAEFFNGSIANFRLFNRALTSDEAWQLYAYQKEYFGHGDLDMTLKAGRLGIGTSEPSAALDVRGSVRFDGRIFHKGVVCCRYINNSNDLYVASTDKIEFNGNVYDPDNLWDTSNHYFITPVNGVYQISCQLLMDNRGDYDGNHEIYVNGSAYSPRLRGYGVGGIGNVHRQASSCFIIPVSAGDTLDVRSIGNFWWYGSGTYAHSTLSIMLVYAT